MSRTKEKNRILLVDDKVENLLALESLLKSPEIEFFRASSGIEALELLLKYEFALAILDVHMPEMDGFELAELMRGTHGTRSVPIIFVTAGAHDRFSTFRGYEKGAVDFLYKPLDPVIVKSKVQVFMELAKQRQLLKYQLQQTQVALAERDQALNEAKEALQTRDEFLSIASHELRTPVTSLNLQLEIMNRMLGKKGPLMDVKVAASDTTSNRFAHAISLCMRQTKKLASLLDELLDLTRVRLGKLQLSKDWVDLVEVTKEVIGRFTNEINQNGAQIDFKSPVDCRGFWDRMRIDQVVTNLVSNSIKYGEKKPISIRLETDQAGVLARFIIEDQGVGIPIDMQDKIFQRFERAVSSENVSGLGLGLYISKQIVAAHGGTIAVKSRVGRGSTFTVEIPFKDIQEQSPEQATLSH